MRTAKHSSLKIFSFFACCFLSTTFNACALMPYASPFMTPQQMQMQLMAQNQGAAFPQNGMSPYPPYPPTGGGFPPYPDGQMGGLGGIPNQPPNTAFDVPATEQSSENQPFDLKNLLNSLKDTLPPEMKDKALELFQKSLQDIPQQPDGSANNMPPIGVPNSMLPYNGPMPNIDTTQSSAPPLYAETPPLICTCQCPQHGIQKVKGESLSEPLAKDIRVCEKQALVLPGDKEYIILEKTKSHDGQNYSQQQMWLLPQRPYMIFSVPSDQDMAEGWQQSMITPPHMPQAPVQLPISVPQ